MPSVIRTLALLFTINLLITVSSQSQSPSAALNRAAGVRPPVIDVQHEQISVNVADVGNPFPHFWDQMFGAGQSTLALRESYRTDLSMVKQITDFKYARFHDIFGDQVGLYNLTADGKPEYNYSYIDQIYDGLQATGVRPFVELSFMPNKLAEIKAPANSWYHPNNSPPKNYELWDDMVEHFVQHLVERYGLDEVSQWYFEVWNEPDYGFPEGVPRQETYFKLYDHTAHDVKHVSPRLRVGGPGTAESVWVTAFLDHCHRGNIPVDFVSTHMYGDLSSHNVFNTNETIPRNRMVCMAAAKVHREISSSPLPRLPFIMSEFNASYMNKPEVTDSVYMGPWLADTIRQCDGLVDMMSYWTFSDVFEEEGVVKKPFYGGFGLVAEDNIPKPAFNAFALLHKLGDIRLNVDSDSALVTRRKDGVLVIALWNYAPPQTDATEIGAPKEFTLVFNGVSLHAKAYVSRVDSTHGNVLSTFDAMGKPSWPNQKQIAQLQASGRLPPVEIIPLRKSSLRLEIPAQGLLLLEIH